MAHIQSYFLNSFLYYCYIASLSILLQKCFCATLHIKQAYSSSSLLIPQLSSSFFLLLMENSMNSMRRVISSSERVSTDVSPEESGWTVYFDDFFNQHNENSCFSSGLESSLISGAASSVEKNKVAHNEQVMGFSREKSSDRLSFKKRKTKVAVVDDDLEDTASSSANSPKKASSSSAQMEKRSTGVLGSIGRENNRETTELKKRGLCLVPLSMITDYLG